jgi:hypothetical protein
LNARDRRVSRDYGGLEISLETQNLLIAVGQLSRQLLCFSTLDVTLPDGGKGAKTGILQNERGDWAVLDTESNKDAK